MRLYTRLLYAGDPLFNYHLRVLALLWPSDQEYMPLRLGLQKKGSEKPATKCLKVNLKILRIERQEDGFYVVRELWLHWEVSLCVPITHAMKVREAIGQGG